MKERLPTMRWLEIRVALVTALAIASAIWSKLALPAAFLTFITFLTLPAERSRLRRILVGCLWLAAGASAVGVVRFVVIEAASGIVQGGSTATAQRALSRVREIITLQDSRRVLGTDDPDGDGIGAAGLITELLAPSPSGTTPVVPHLEVKNASVIDTPVGPALSIGGYLFVVCLPKAGGNFTADPDEPVDKERAERRFAVYAWPAGAEVGGAKVFFGDEHERLLVLEASGARYVGAESPPPCDAALDVSGTWKPWRGKQPRQELPGDRPGAKGGS